MAKTQRIKIEINLQIGDKVLNVQEIFTKQENVTDESKT